MLFFIFDQALVPDNILEPIVIEARAEYPLIKVFHLVKDGIRYYGMEDTGAIDTLRNVLQQRGLPFTETEESELPEWHRHHFADLRHRN